jgi:hypothetical protein
MLHVACPRQLPDGNWSVSAVTVRRRGCAYLVDLTGTPRDERDVPFHLLFGGRCRRWALAATGGRWPALRLHGDDLGLYPGRDFCDEQSTSQGCARPLDELFHGRVAWAGGIVDARRRGQEGDSGRATDPS